MRALISKAHEWCIQKRISSVNGVSSFFSAKWFVVATAYILSAAFMGQDPWFGRDDFVYAQGGFVILISFVLVATVSFDWCYLGKSRGGNLVLQFLLILPMTLLIGRLIGPSSSSLAGTSTILKYVCDAFKNMAGIIGLLDMIPAPIRELFASPRIAFLFALICLLLSVGKQKMTRVGLLVTVFVVLIAFTVADAKQPPSCLFFLGVLFMIAGIALQFHDTSSEVIDNNIVRRLRNVTDEAERRSSIRILKTACSGNMIAFETAREIIRRCYVDKFGVSNERVYNEIAPVLIRRLVIEHQLLCVSHVYGEWRFKPAEELFMEDSAWLAVALVPRSVIIGIFAIFWWLMPVDIFPDAVPIVGFIDDFIIVSLGGGVAWRTLMSIRRKRIRNAE